MIESLRKVIIYTPEKERMSPKKELFQKERRNVVFQALFSGDMLVFKGVCLIYIMFQTS